MKPKQKEQINVQTILDNPVASTQKALHIPKEGILGWLSYAGWTLTIIFPLVLMIYQSPTMYSYIEKFKTSYDFYFPFHNYIVHGVLIGIGILFTLITMWKSKFPISPKTKIFLFFVSILYIESPLHPLLFFDVVWFFLFCWYIQYFYKKSKNGYRYVWLKVLLFTLIGLLPFFVIKRLTQPWDDADWDGWGLMGDVMY